MPFRSDNDERRPDRRWSGLLQFAVTWWGEKPIAQLGLFVGAGLIFALLGTNFTSNMHRLGLSPGFNFLWRSSDFEIGETLIPYVAGNSYGRAILVGLLNTLLVSVSGCLLATVLGVLLGVARLSTNPLLSGSVQGYIEIVRNTPLLLQLFFWNTAIRALPSPRSALAPLPGVLLTNRGLYLPSIGGDTASRSILAAIAIALGLVGVAWWRRRRRRQPLPLSSALLLICAAVLVPLLVAGAFGITVTIDVPQQRGFNIAGGYSLSPEFAALLVALVVNAAAGIAEIVRAGILSVPQGQWEAARALGLSPSHILRFVVLPQALRVIIPVLTSSYLSLTKNSSLAVAIGFPDLVNILNTTANVTGQALEAIFIMMLVYLTLSLAVSFAMNIYNQRAALREGR